MNLASQWQDGQMAESQVEDVIEALWPDVVHHIGTDHYDNSLEVCFLPSAEPSLSINDEQAKVITGMGFGRCWLNFLDGTEQYAQFFPAIQFHPRKAVTHPHWTKERMEKFQGAPLNAPPTL